MVEICFNMHEESSEYVFETKYEFKFGIQPCYSCFVRYANASLGWGTPIPHGRDEKLVDSSVTNTNMLAHTGITFA